MEQQQEKVAGVEVKYLLNLLEYPIVKRTPRGRIESVNFRYAHDRGYEISTSVGGDYKFGRLKQHELIKFFNDNGISIVECKV